MGLEEEICRARAARAKAEQDRHAWRESPLGESDPTVLTATGDFAVLVTEALPLLRRSRADKARAVWVGTGPDGVLRVTFDTNQQRPGRPKSPERPKSRGWHRSHVPEGVVPQHGVWPGSNQRAWVLTVSIADEKGGSSLKDTLILLDDGRIAWMGARTSAEAIRESIVRDLA
jgi:hypothetical protein